jgi:hypothetical protein
MSNWLEAKLTFKSFLPLRLEVGMMFFRNLKDGEVELFVLDKLPEDHEEFMKWNSTPIELFIVDEEEDIIASHDEIGWWDEGDDVDHLSEVTIKHLNTILNTDDGILDIQMDETESGYTVVIAEGKVIIRYVQDPSEFEEEEEDIICSSCNGTGEGMYDGSTCSVCDGLGVQSQNNEYD